MLEPTRGENVLFMYYLLLLVLPSQNELVETVKMQEPIANSGHNQIHFDNKVKPESKNKKNIQDKLQQR